MRCLAPLLFMILTFASPADAEPVSLRCDGKYYEPRQPYFVTYDLTTNHFVFEVAGSNKVRGEIIAATDEKLDISLSALGGRILLYFDRKRNSMTWPGMPAGELGRHLLNHDCTAVSGRTMISVFYPPERFDPKRLDPVDAFSLTCPGKFGGEYFVTLDRATKAVVLEKESASGYMSGNITSIDDGVIKFSLAYGSEPFDLLWDERRRSLTWVGVENDQSRPTTVQECITTKPRSIMEIYRIRSQRR